jgi:hypothetical protein
MKNGGLKKLRLAAGISRTLVAGLIPLLVWVLISALLLYLIEVRSIFILGGEPRLRQGVLAFALGVVLIQRLSRQQVKSIVQAYAYALSFTILFFAAHQAYAYRVPGIHPLIVFLVNIVLFAILWWVGHTITAACSADSDSEQEEVAETGILYHTGRAWKRLMEDTEREKEPENRDELWTDRLSGPHPGRVIFYFSLFAIPAFGLGFYLFDPKDFAARLLIGAFLSIYLWCAFALLALSHLRQLAVYLAKRDISLPDVIGLTWISLAGIVITLVLLAAVILPQPPSLPGFFVRHRIISVYRGWEARHGFKDSAQRAGQTAGKNGRDGQGAGKDGGDGKGAGEDSHFPGVDETAQRLNQRYQQIDKMGDKELSKMARNTGWEPELQGTMKGLSAINDGFRKVFDFLLKALFVVLALCCPFVLYLIFFGAWQKLSARAGIALRALRKLRILLPAKRGSAESAPSLKRRRFMDFADPFDSGGQQRDIPELVRACWEAMLAFCADQDAPCPPHVAPLEFVASAPQPLRGFEEHAFYIACLFNFSEFSGQVIPDETRLALKEFWGNLQRHAQVAHGTPR